MTAYDWDSTIEKDGGDFRLLEPGVYPFTIKKVEKGFHNGSASVPPCPKAIVTIHVGTVQASSDVTDNMMLDDSLEWKLCQFFLGIGARKHGEPLKMNWDDSFLVGKAGWVEIGHRSYTKDDEEKTVNQVVRYIDPAEAPADGQPVLTGGGETAADEW